MADETTITEEAVNPREITLQPGQFDIGGVPISRIVVEPISFVRFASVTGSISVSDVDDYAKTLTRKRIAEQAKAYTADGKSVPWNEPEILRLPIKAALDLIVRLDLDESEPGVVLNDGNGVTSPILYKLGKPLKTSNGEFTELEFQAKTFGDVETVISAFSAADRTLALLRTVAKPVSDSLKMQALPSWAIDAISLRDGNQIGREILPRFFE